MAVLARPVNRAGGAGQGTQAVIGKHSHDLPIGLSHGPRDGSVVSLPRLRATRSLATGRDKSRPAEFDSGGSGRSLTAARERPMAFKRQAGGVKRGGVTMLMLLTDFVLFSGLALWITGIVIAAASLLS